ncbi:organic cation transporter protein-like isoform X2 [Centruroides sculpturatus]|uniref:organic cation transporter protein-like isoform X2 n=1 Tax=Centruroides sculpturatus TaxID=218467 RepID=UPI000C6CD935|nr:organic cation transporter protein-like isoform X2 [Centruroides sculpturatus]
MKFTKILYHLGFGKFQVYICLLVGVLQIFGGLQLNSNLFYMHSFVPKSNLQSSRCYVPTCDNSTSDYNEPWVEYAIPKDGSGDDSLDEHQCTYYESKQYPNTTSCSRDSFTKTLVECDDWKWDKEVFESTVVSDFKLVCKSKSKKTMSEALFMFGVLTGSVTFGHAADRWGRKSVFLVAPAMLAASSISTAFANSLPLFSFLRFVTAASVSGLFQTGYVLAIEFVGKTKRLWCANSLQMVFAVGELLLAGAAAISKKNWQTLQLIISAPTVLLLGYNWLLPESARWQISKNQFHKARSTILKAASWNKVTIPENLLRSLNDPGLHENTRHTRSNPIDLVRTPTMRKWTLNLFFNWIVNAMVYYGLSLSASKFSNNVYLSFSVMALVEIPAIALSTVLLKRIGRRPVLCWVMILGGICCLTTPFIPKIYGTIMAILGKAAIGASFSIIYIYSSEIYPTVLRNTGLGMSSMCARLGGIVAPFIAGMRQFHSKLPMIIFGVSTIIAGVLAFLLPETNNRELPENIDEAEKLKSRDSGDERSQIDSQDDEERLRLLAG